jgi:hypothetical protein
MPKMVKLWKQKRERNLIDCTVSWPRKQWFDCSFGEGNPGIKVGVWSIADRAARSISKDHEMVKRSQSLSQNRCIQRRFLNHPPESCSQKRFAQFSIARRFYKTRDLMERAGLGSWGWARVGRELCNRGKRTIGLDF